MNAYDSVNPLLPQHMDCCNDTVALFQSQLFWTAEMIKLVVGPSSTLLNLLLLYLLSHCRPLHVNVRNLLVNLTACNMFAGFYLTAKSALAMNAVSNGNRLCYLPVWRTAQLCSFQTATLFATLLSTIGTFVSLQLERLVATLFLKNYEARPKGTLSIFLLFAVWTTTIACTSSLVANLNQEVGVPAFCNEMLAVNQTTSALVVSMVSCIQVLGLMLYIAAWLIHRCKSSGQSANGVHDRHTLTYRLQLQKSLVTVEMLLPSVVLNAVTWSVVNMFVSVTKLQPNANEPPQQIDPISYTISSQYFFYLPVLLQAFFHPLLFIWHLPPATIRLGIGKPFCDALLLYHGDRVSAEKYEKDMLIKLQNSGKPLATIVPRHLEYCDMGILLDIDSEEVIKLEDYYDNISIVSGIKQLANAIDSKI